MTGDAGFIGSHVADAFINAGCEVAIIDNLQNGGLDHVNPCARFYEADITDVEPLDRIFAARRDDCSIPYYGFPPPDAYYAKQAANALGIWRIERDTQHATKLFLCCYQAAPSHQVA